MLRVSGGPILTPFRSAASLASSPVLTESCAGRRCAIAFEEDALRKAKTELEPAREVLLSKK
eukprot:1597861-Lingulodinium_polyedra.AAC.1